jgi:hypothetical protein
MARIFIDGFESASHLTKWQVVSGTPVITSGASTYGFSGTYFLNLSDGRIYRTTTAKDYYYISFRVYWSTTSSTNNVALRFGNSTTVLGSVKFDLSADKLTKVYRGDGSTLVTGGTGTKELNIANCYRIEVYYKPSTGTSGDFYTKVDGVADISCTGVQTANNALQVTRIDFGMAGGGMWIDDIVFDDAAWIGNTRIQGILPTAVGNLDDFTSYPSGDNYTTVDDRPYSDADYNYTNTVDHIDLFGMGNLDESLKTISTIKCIDVIARAKIDGTATPTKLALALRTASTNYAGTDQTVTQDQWNFYNQIWEVSPNTSVAWLKSEINGIECGYKARS